MISLKNVGTALLASALALSGLLLSGQANAAGDVCKPFGPAQTNVTDIPTLQRGARLYFNYCASCHSLEYVRYSGLAKDLQLSEEDVLANFAFTGAKAGDYAKTNMPAGGRGNTPGGQEWFGQVPPDLTLVARSRGVDWIYNYLKAFYPDPSRPIGWNNLTFPNASMPNPLWELQGIQSLHAAHASTDAAAHCGPDAFKLDTPGTRTALEYDADIADLTSFLEYVGEPAVLKRETFGVWALLYLGLLTFLFWLLKNEYWKDVH
jgi:ubiquinol-cytochrome c reductase cytochrome c1 subunit